MPRSEGAVGHVPPADADRAGGISSSPAIVRSSVDFPQPELLYRSFAATIPRDLDEAARIDGAKPWRPPRDEEVARRGLSLDRARSEAMKPPRVRWNTTEARVERFVRLAQRLELDKIADPQDRSPAPASPRPHAVQEPAGRRG